MNIDPIDQPKFDQMIADFLYFGNKYGTDKMGQLLFARLLNPHMDKLANMSDEEKSLIFASGVEGLSKAAAGMHDQLFPFGHAGQPLEIQE